MMSIIYLNFHFDNINFHTYYSTYNRDNMRVLMRAVTYLVISMNIFFANGWIKTQLITKQQKHRRKFGLVHHATQYTIDDSICPPTRPHLLKKAVTKACASIDTYLSRKPIAAHTQQAFDNLVEMIGPDISKMQIVLDSGCGTGRSTILLGESHPNHLVIGVDRSFTRLSKTIQHQPEHYDWTNNHDDDDDDNQEDDDVLAASSKRPYCQKFSENTFLVRAELVDFWTCCLQKRLTISEHYLLYPNPYPTQTRLTQRWYAHPSFPLILQMRSDTIVLRSNWEGYLKETAKAVEIAYEYYESLSSSSSTHQDNHALPYLASARRGPEKRTDKTIAWTNFEQKYDDVGEETYELILQSNKL